MLGSKRRIRTSAKFRVPHILANRNGLQIPRRDPKGPRSFTSPSWAVGRPEREKPHALHINGPVSASYFYLARSQNKNVIRLKLYCGNLLLLCSYYPVMLGLVKEVVPCALVTHPVMPIITPYCVLDFQRCHIPILAANNGHLFLVQNLERPPLHIFHTEVLDMEEASSMKCKAPQRK